MVQLQGRFSAGLVDGPGVILQTGNEAVVIHPHVPLAGRTKLVDRPDDLLKPHGQPVAYLGGVAMCLGLLAGLAVYVAVMPHRLGHWNQLRESLAGGQFELLSKNPLWNLMAIALASVLITVVGLLDDVLELRPKIKVLGQVSAAAILLAGGVGHEMAEMFFGHLYIPLPPVWVLTSLSSLICIVMIIAAYIMAIKGITLVLSPYWFRKWNEIFVKTNKTCRALGLASLVVAILIVTLGLTVY